jgi:hypothetical protein
LSAAGSLESFVGTVIIQFSVSFSFGATVGAELEPGDLDGDDEDVGVSSFAPQALTTMAETIDKATI